MNFIPYPVNCVMQILLKHYTNPHYERIPCTYLYIFWPLCVWTTLILRCFLFFSVILNAVFCYFSQLHLLWQNNELCCLANRNKKPWNVCYLSMWYQFIHYQFGQFRQYTVKDNKVELFWKCRNYIFISKLLSLWLMIASNSNQSKDIPT